MKYLQLYDAYYYQSLISSFKVIPNWQFIAAWVFLGICVFLFIATAIFQLCLKFRHNRIAVITPSVDLNLDVGFVHYHSMNISTTLDSIETYHLKYVNEDTTSKV